MRNMKILSAGLVGAGFWLGAVAASADTVIVMDHSVSGAKSGDSNAGDATDKPMTMYLAGDRMSMALEKMGFIYRGDLNKVWVVQPEQHSYFEVTPASMGEMADRVNQMKAMMKSRLAGLPEAQRKQVEDMMAKNGLSQDSSAPAAANLLRKGGRGAQGRRLELPALQNRLAEQDFLGTLRRQYRRSRPLPGTI